MRQLIILWMIVMLQHSTGAQYPSCASCPSDGSIPLSPLSYNTMRSNVFDGTQPSNEGCTNGVSIDGQVTIDCGQGTTIIDCDRGFNGGDYSDLSRTFAWNRTTSVAQQVSIVFRFDQQINISRITMFFWNSQSNSIKIPNMRMYWSNDDSITPSNEITITTSSPSRTGDGRRRMNIDVSDNGLQFQYLRMEMNFYNDSEWIFLNEVQFCGNAAPYNITQPSTDNDVQIVSPNATMTSITCSLNITIPSTVVVTWSHNASLITDLSQITITGSTTTLLIGDLQSSDAGIYQCVFNDTAGYVLRRRTTLLIVDIQIIQPPVDFFIVTFNESSSSVQLTCSLNINIPSSVTVSWIYRSSLFAISPPNEVIQSGNTATLLLGRPQPSDFGEYECFFVEFNERRIITLKFQNTTASSTTSAVSSTAVVSSMTEVTSSAVLVTESTMVTTNSSTSSMQSTPVTVPTSSPTVLPPAESSTTTTSSTSSSVDVIASSSSTTNVSMGNSGSDGGSNVGAIVAPIIIILILVIIIIVLVIGFFVWRRRQHKYSIAHSETYYSSVNETKLKSLTVDSNTHISHFSGPPNGDTTQLTGPVYSVPRRDSKREPKSVEKTQSIVSNQSSPPIVPDRTSKYDEFVENTLYGKQPNGIMETDGESIDDEILDDSFDEDENLTPLHNSKKGVSPRRGKSKSPSKTPTKKAKQPSSSSTQSSLLSPLKSFGSHSSGVDNVSVEGDKTLKGLHTSMQPNPLYASSQSLTKPDDKTNIELNIYDSIQSPKHDNLAFTESIYSEIAEPNTLITTENPTVDSVKDAKDLYPYSSIYAEPLPLDKSESPPLVTSQNVTEVQLLGTGQFGEVVLANTVGLSKFYLQLDTSEDCSISLKVAVKKLKLNSTKEMQQAFEKEIKFMSRLKDDNVIRLLGICTTGTPFIMMEYMENGDLNQYLQRFELLLDPDEAPSENQITPVTLIYMAYQIASGMKYLSSLKYVHRDLATRNILVGKDYVVKIADFGMSQNLYSAYYFKVKGRAILPIRWMAYECFFGKFSVKTDVWAFGITLWEIFTLAKQQPYHNMEDQEVIDSALKGESRQLMSKPENCPDEIYEVMLRCWVHDPGKRATFAELYETLKEINNRQ